jgi:Mg-chelatase subunit ChlD
MAEVPLEVAVPADVPGDTPVRISVRASSADDQTDTASTDFEPAGDAAPSDPRRSWRVPEALLGGLDVASEALGAVPLVSLDAGQEARLHDGFAAPDWGLSWPIGGLPVSLTIDLAGDDPVPVAGTLLHPLSEDPSLGDAVRELELALSTDGATWETVVTGSLDPVAVEQAFVLPAPIEARYAQLRVMSLQRELPSRLDLGEWKVVATPGWSPPTGPLDLADERAGGHVVRMTPQPEPVELMGSLLDEGTAPATLAVEPRGAVEWVLGFMEDRAALVSSVQWRDPVPTDASARLDRVELAGSFDSPLGPWQTLGTWEFARAADGSVTPFVLERPSWVRFLRVTGTARRGQDRVELPDRIRVFESPQDSGYRSVIGQWGMGEPAGPFEWSTPPTEPAIDELADSDSPDQPGALVAGTAARGWVHFDEDADWYRISVPDDMRSAALTLRGRASASVALILHAEDGSEVPMAFSSGDASGSVTYHAALEPGASYVVEVQQPRSSIVVAFDTSASVATELAAIETGLRRLAESISNDRESLLILPFDGDPLLPSWSSDGYEIADAVNRYQLGPSSSAVESNLRRAALELGAREGGRAILLITDAASSSAQETARLWATLSGVRPQVFTVEVGGEAERPAIKRRHLMADWAASSVGYASQARGAADILEAFDRLATWLRRPVTYSLSYEPSPEELPPPEPGRLAVLSPEHEGVRPAVLATDAAIDLVVDTSGSMRKRLGDRTRIDIAKDVLTRLVREDLPVGTQVALRQFPPPSDPCGSLLLTPLGPLEPASVVGTIAGLTAPKDARTPLARAIAAVADDLEGATGRRIVVVVSDGRESCKGDPAAEVKRLRAAGYEVTLNVVGLTLDRASRKGIARLADLGGGSYFDASDAESLGAALRAAVSAPFEIVDRSGAIVGRGTVGGDPVAIPMGRYLVTVATEPPVTFEGVLVQPDADVVLTLTSAD